jgi:2-isopropylmalate synthase
MLKERTTYEIMTPESIGRTDSRIVISKHSGRNAFRDRLKQLGYELDDDEFMRAFGAFKELADKKKDVTDGDVEAVVADQVLTVEETFRLEHLLVTCGDPAVPTATVRLGIAAGETRQGAATGDGPVDAVYQAITHLVDIPNRLTEFSVQSVTAGIDAMGEVSVRVESDEGTFIGRGASTDIVVAAARAYLNALNKVVAARRDREAGHSHRPAVLPDPAPGAAAPEPVVV